MKRESHPGLIGSLLSLVVPRFQKILSRLGLVPLVALRVLGGPYSEQEVRGRLDRLVAEIKIPNRSGIGLAQ